MQVRGRGERDGLQHGATHHGALQQQLHSAMVSPRSPPPSLAVAACTGCRSFFYCSSECESSSESLHAFVCPLVNQLESAASAASCDADLLLLVATLIGGHLVEQRAAAANDGHASESPSDGLTRATWLHVQDLMANRDTAQADWLVAIELGVKGLLQLYKGHAIFEGLQLPAADTVSQARTDKAGGPRDVVTHSAWFW